ncbi:hypothetical protein [Soonwooa sp.]|uniref:hypothetical protein n=1 Tax=Soonwooa sp. TaxID=1938592 RepID=UPI002896C6BF|nr:hypothetical protein [Soonwooa sp.]
MESKEKEITMISNYNYQVFKGKLNELTTKGKPEIKGNPFAILSFNNSKCPFYDLVNEGEFRISRNSNFFSIPFLIEGNFSENKYNTDVNYQVKPIAFGYYWLRILPALINFILIISFIINYKRLEIDSYKPDKIIVAILLFEIFIFAPLFFSELGKRKFETKFLEELKILNKNS